jgi:hypothetical protein
MNKNDLYVFISIILYSKNSDLLLMFLMGFLDIAQNYLFELETNIVHRHCIQGAADKPKKEQRNYACVSLYLWPLKIVICLVTLSFKNRSLPTSYVPDIKNA